MSKQILMIEDEEMFRDTLEEILVEEGYAVDNSPYLATAVSKALTGRYDLITLDLRMPGLDGLDIARLLTHQITTPILVISGYLTRAIKSRLQKMGIRHILPKPSSIPQLVSAVDDAIAR